MTSKYLVNGIDLTSLFQNNLTSTFYTPTGPAPVTGYKTANGNDLGQVLAPLFQGVTGPATGIKVSTGTLNYSSPYSGGDLNTLFAAPFFQTAGLSPSFRYTQNTYALIYNVPGFQGTISFNLPIGTILGFLIVGGGGGGGGSSLTSNNRAAQGGGGGAVIYGNGSSSTNGIEITSLGFSLDIYVGAKGQGSVRNTPGSDGQASLITISNTNLKMQAGGGFGGGDSGTTTGLGKGGSYEVLISPTAPGYGYGGSGGGGGTSTNSSAGVNLGSPGGSLTGSGTFIIGNSTGNSGNNSSTYTSSPSNGNGGTANMSNLTNNIIPVPFINSNQTTIQASNIICGNGGGGGVGAPNFRGGGAGGLFYNGTGGLDSVNAGGISGNNPQVAGMSASNGYNGYSNTWSYGNGGGGASALNNSFGGDGSSGVVMLWWSHK